MPKYLLTRNYNVRAHEKLYFEALNDDAAKQVAMSIRGTIGLKSDREYSEKDADDLDELRDLTRLQTSAYTNDEEDIIEGEPLPECLPLSWTAADLVKRLAEIGAAPIPAADAQKLLSEFAKEAINLCGMEA